MTPPQTSSDTGHANGLAAIDHRITPQALDHEASRGEGFLIHNGVRLYRVPDVDSIPPFLMTLASESDLWMYVSSAGSLTAGRRSPAGALFPYDTEDRLHRGFGLAGPVTLLRTTTGPNEHAPWEPFAPWAAGTHIHRALYRDDLGSRVIFEEIHRRLGLRFRWQWNATEEFGFVRTASLENIGPRPARLELLDGLVNILPAGVATALQSNFSCLVDAYKQTDLDIATGLALYSLTSKVGDSPEPGEVLLANAVYAVGLPGAAVCLDEDAIRTFRRGGRPASSVRRDGARGAYLLSTHLTLEPGESARWRIVADVEQCHSRVRATRARLQAADDLAAAIDRATRATDTGLRRIVAAGDGLQLSRDPRTTARHGLNVLLNHMRGGLPISHYSVETADFLRSVHTRNRATTVAASALAATLPPRLTTDDLLAAAGNSGSTDLLRLAMEYVPLTFGRRHGDPSRPWNQFAIRVRDEHGRPAVGYQGNWRDIFQNWESLSLSYPRLLPQFVAKFVNASTPDGFNPYRLTSDGIEWEAPAPDEPWSHLGYWGDHQIVYLLRLLEHLHAHDPSWIPSWLGRSAFAFANVPYDLVSHAHMLSDPRRTIHFDTDRDHDIKRRVERMGTDGRLLLDREGRVQHATLLEKLLIPILAKLCAVVPGGGVWLNTQRPEWNDANNALAGWGLSVVTLGYMLRYLRFLGQRLAELTPTTLPVSAELVAWIDGIRRALAHADLHACHTDPAARRAVLDSLGQAFESYRHRVYRNGFTAKANLDVKSCQSLIASAGALVDAALQSNERPDGLFHSYNILSPETGGGLGVARLSEMLEGQVSILSSGLLDVERSTRLIESLFKSRLYRPDVGSFMLYPTRSLPDFLARNRIPPARIDTGGLMAQLLAAGENSIVRPADSGHTHFHPSLTSARELAAALDRLAADPRWKDLVAAGRADVIAAYEDVFHHSAFTGRSGTMHAYEGIGSIYWHMVGKLLVAVQEVFWREADDLARPDPLRRLASAYYRIRDGLGYKRSAAEYGAVPIEPYSHTPAGGGARQPGMTGQVKEELLTRRGELGVRVSRGRLRFDPRLLRRDELLDAPAVFEILTSEGGHTALPLPPRSLAFTVCQTPVVYLFGTVASTTLLVRHRGGAGERVIGDTLDSAVSDAIFRRTADIAHIEVTFPASLATYAP
jgi:hypothetical protein